MDQKKIGSFLKELRKEKQLTQQQFAEILGVSNRSVSRWENGSNMPDLDLVIEIADYHDVDLREILDGERKSEKMDKEMKETVMKVAEYSNDEKHKFTKRLHIMFIVAIICFGIFMAIEISGLAATGLIGFIKGVAVGIDFGMLIVGALYTSRHFKKFRDVKMRLLRMDKM